jgi:hypothetical protein
VTSALVEFGGREYLLSHVEETTGQRCAARRREPLDRCALLDDVAAPGLLEERLAVARTRAARSGLRTAVLVVGPDPLGPDPLASPAPAGGTDADAVAAVGGVLQAVLRSADTVVRLDGPVFAVVAPDVPDQAALDRLVERVEAAFAHPARNGCTGTGLVVGVGATLLGPAEAGAAAVRRATEALAAVWRERPPAERLDLRETDLRETDLRETGPDPGHGGTDGEAPLAERQL